MQAPFMSIYLVPRVSEGMIASEIIGGLPGLSRGVEWRHMGQNSIIQ